MDAHRKNRRIRVPWLIVGTLAGAVYAWYYSRSPVNAVRSGTLANAAEGWHWPEYVIAGMAVGFLVGLIVDCVLALMSHKRSRTEPEN